MQRRVYDKRADFWSVGFILWQFLEDPAVVIQKMEQSKEATYNWIVNEDQAFDLAGPAWEVISDEGKDLIGRLLKVDPKERIQMHDIKVHDWFKSKEQIDAER
jgi:serine/threonine protein kinase